LSKFVSVGFGSYVDADKAVAVLNPDSAPIRRKIQEAKENGNLVDSTYGRKVRTVIVMESGQLVTCAISTDTLAERLNKD